MKKNLKLKFCFLFLLFFCITVSGQEVISSAGDFHLAGGHSVSWTIGEPVIDTWSAGGHVLTQGFQQPILDIVSVYEYPELTYDINAFPNPTSDVLNLVVINGDLQKLSYQLFDITGKLLESKQIISKQTEIMFVNLPVATYFVRVIEGNTELKTFKIVKQ